MAERRKRKVRPLETTINANGEVKKRVAKDEEVIQVETPKGTRYRRKPKVASPKESRNPDNLLTPREEAFAATVVQRMLAGQRGGIGQAARDAGYQGAQAGSALLKRPAVLRVVDETLNQALEKVDAETAWLLERLADIIDFDPRALTEEITDLEDATALALAGVDTEHVFEGRGNDRQQTGTIKKWKQYNKLDAIRIFLEFKKLLGTARVNEDAAMKQRSRLDELEAVFAAGPVKTKN